MNAQELLIAVFGGGGVIAGIIKLGEWLFGASAKRAADRRSSLEEDIKRRDTDLDRQDQDIRELRQAINDQRNDYERRINECWERVRRAEGERAIAEGQLYRFGFEKTERGWKRNGGTKP